MCLSGLLMKLMLRYQLPEQKERGKCLWYIMQLCIIR